MPFWGKLKRKGRYKKGKCERKRKEKRYPKVDACFVWKTG
jgi:hypothetical protein